MPAIYFGVQEKSDFFCINGETDGEGGSFASMAPMEPELAEVQVKPHQSSNVVTVLVDSGASSPYFDHTIIPDLKHRLQDYISLSTPRTIFTAGGALLDGTPECMLQGLITDDNGEQNFAMIAILLLPGIGRNLFSVKTAARTASLRYSMSTNPGWRLATLPCHFAEITAKSTPSSWTPVRMDTQGRSWRRMR